VRRLGYFMKRGKNLGCVRRAAKGDEGCGLGSSSSSFSSAFVRGDVDSRGALAASAVSVLCFSSMWSLKHLIEQLKLGQFYTSRK
jgi:hypothetical protein